MDRRLDPGDCPICGAPHCSCTDSGPIAIAQLPNRDAALQIQATEGPAELVPPPGEPETFTTATYRGRNRDGTLKKPAMSHR